MRIYERALIIFATVISLFFVYTAPLYSQDSTSIHVRWTDLGVSSYEWFGKHILNGIMADSLFKDEVPQPETIWRVPNPPNPGDSIQYETCARAKGVFEDSDGNAVSAPWGCLQWNSRRLPPVPPPPTITVDTAQVVDVASNEVIGRVWVGAPDSIVGAVRILADGFASLQEWTEIDGMERPHDPWMELGEKRTLCAYAFVTKTWDDGNDYPWAHNYGLAPGEELFWGSSGDVVFQDWREANGWQKEWDQPCGPADVPGGINCAPMGMSTCVEVWRTA